MALILADRVKESTTTTGTSDFALGGAVTGFQSFATAVGANNTTYYAIADGADWEVGLGTLSSDGLTLVRTTVYQSSNSDTKVSFAAGAKHLFVTYAADKAVFEDASGNVTLPANLTVTGGSTTDSVQLDLTAGVTPAVGQIAWDAAQGTATLGLLGGNVLSRLGESLVAYVTNAESTTITKGQAVYLFGAQGDRATVKLANNTGDATSAKTLGIVAEDITANGTGFVVCQGVVYGLDLSAYTAGDTIYLGSTAGTLTATKPYAPNHLVYLGVVEKANAGAGQLYVRVQNGYELDELHNVSAQSPSNGNTLVYNTSNSLWEASSTLSGSYTISGGTANGVTYLNGSKVLTTGSALTFDGTGSLNVSTSATNGSVSVIGPSSGTNNGAQFSIVNGSTTTSSIGNYSRVIGGSYNESLAFYNNGNDFVWYSTSERMRLTSTGLGIGTSSPSYKLQVANSSTNVNTAITGSGIVVGSGLAFREKGASNGIGGSQYPVQIMAEASYGNIEIFHTGPNYGIVFGTNSTERMRLDKDGNLGLGVTPSAWSSSYKALQLTGGAVQSYLTGYISVGQNNYDSGTGAWKYVNTNYATRYQQGDGTHQWFIAPSGTAGNAITFTQAMTLDSSGRLLVNATSSIFTSSKIQVTSASGPSLGAQVTSSNQYAGGFWNTSNTGNLVAFFTGAGGSQIGSITGTTTTLNINGPTAGSGIAIDSSGNLLVGTTSSSTNSNVGVKVLPAGNVALVNAASTNADSTYLLYSTGAGAYRFYVGMGGTISATSTTITAISDQRLKENIRDLDEGLATVMALKPRKFDWKEGKGQDIKNARGFIAQEFETVLPDMIENWLDPAPEGEEPYKAINANLIPTLVKAIQELKAEFDAYKASHP